MRDVKRIKRIVGKIEELWNMYPDMRFGQLLVNYVYGDGQILWHAEDDGLEKHLCTVVDDLWKRRNRQTSKEGDALKRKSKPRR